MGIQIRDHSADRRFHQPPVIDRLDVVLANPLENLREEPCLLPRKRF